MGCPRRVEARCPAALEFAPTSGFERPPWLPSQPEEGDLRTILVVSPAGELAEALRDVVPREMAMVRDARPEEAVAVIGFSAPFPWMIVTDAAVDAPPAVAVARRHPVILASRGPVPAGAPGHARGFAVFAALADFVSGALRGTVGGMRLGRGAGVDLVSGEAVRAAALEALVALHPFGFDLPLARFRSAAHALERRGIPWRPVRDRGAGGVVLAPLAGASA